MPETSPLRSLATNTPPAAPAPVSVTPSLSAVPEPPGKRSVLPADHPFAVSGCHPPEPLPTSRQSFPEFWAPHITAPSW
ncbi:hypothetical protein ACFQ0T_42255 [Kitasatospora gansuensis]